jgi:diadenosine tetraphosphate (Ap4A) HIT family hydrolase
MISKKLLSLGGKLMDDWKKDRFAAFEQGRNPMVIAKMKSGFAVIGDTQFLPGYCLLIAYPKVDQLNDLEQAKREEFLSDMSLLGEAVQSVCNPRRINYSILGNTDPFLHAHVFPRFEWEPDEAKRYPVWRYPNEKWTKAEFQYNDENHGQLKAELKNVLNELIIKVYK